MPTSSDGSMQAQPDQERLEAFLASLPKAELHLHVEGSLEPELMMELGRKNGVPLPFADAAEAAQARHSFRNLQDFLDLYYAGMSVLCTADDFYRLTDACLARLAAEGVRVVEMFFDPQAHTGRGITWSMFFPGLQQAVAEAPQRHGIAAGLIMCFLRDLGPEAAADTLEQALPYRPFILGVGLDSSEAGFPPGPFAEVFRRAAQLGWHRVAHAGEEGGPGYVREALESLGVQRIDHGIRSLEDPELVTCLEAAGTPLTLCPLSNLRLQERGAHRCWHCLLGGAAGIRRLLVYSGCLDEKLRQLLSTRLVVTVNSDDPAYFGGYVNRNYAFLARAAGLSAEQLARLAAASFGASFLLDATAKQRHIAEVQAALARFMGQES